MVYEKWEGSAELTGYGALVASTYPITTGQQYDAAGERVDLELSEPVEIPGQLDANQYKQTISIKVYADRTRAEELAMEAILEQADRIAFATDRRVKTTLVQLQQVPPDKKQDEGRTILYARRWKGPQDLALVNVDFLDFLSQQIGDPTSDRGLRKSRALRWLRRASLADDEVEEFAILMMGLDGLKKLLPVPPAKSQGKQKGKGRKLPPSKPGINATLGHFAIEGCGIQREEWKRVWELRNDLFHGDLTENAETRSKIAGAIPHLRLTLGLALKHVLGLPHNAPPYLSLPPYIITGIQITAPSFTPLPDPPPKEQDDEDTS